SRRRAGSSVVSGTDGRDIARSYYRRWRVGELARGRVGESASWSVTNSPILGNHRLLDPLFNFFDLVPDQPLRDLRDDLVDAFADHPIRQLLEHARRDFGDDRVGVYRR